MPDSARGSAGPDGTDHVDLHQLHLSGAGPEAAARLRDACEELSLTSVNRSPLAMGLLTGRYRSAGTVAAGGIRAAPPGWLRRFTPEGPSAAWMARAEAVREVLTADGRTLAQGAIGWLWARSPRTVPIPGFRDTAQAGDNAGALIRGPLTRAQMREIDDLLTTA